MSARAAGIVALALAPLLAGFALTRAEDPDVARANVLYRAGEFMEALSHYRAAEERGPSPILDFNRGAALYKLAEASEGADRRRYLADAARQLARAAASGERATRAAATYNLGNVRFRQGRYAAAVEAFKASLRADPSRAAARHNLALALRARAQAAALDEPRGADGRPGDGDPRDAPESGRAPIAPERPDAGRGDEARPGPQEPDSRPRAERSERDEREPASLEDVERKLDELERLSREVWLERLRRRAARAERGEAPW